MHELGLAEGIMTVAIDISGERPVNRIVVRIGEEQRIVPDSLEFGFQPVSYTHLDVYKRQVWERIDTFFADLRAAARTRSRAHA